MVLSKCLVAIQQDLLNYISDKYIDLSNKQVIGQNRLNEALKEYGISFKYTAGKVDSGSNNLIYVLFQSSSGERFGMGGHQYNDNITMTITARQIVNSVNSTLSYTVVNSVIQDVIREWFSNYRNMPAIRNASYSMNEPEFFYSGNDIDSFNSINSIKYTNTITFELINFKE